VLFCSNTKVETLLPVNLEVAINFNAFDSVFVCPNNSAATTKKNKIGMFFTAEIYKQKQESWHKIVTLSNLMKIIVLCIA
jgi:hypothetical protein